MRAPRASRDIRLRESQIEDVLATYPDVPRQLVGSEDTFRLLARQMSLGSGRLDLLWSTGARLLLMELKIEPCRQEFIDQVLAYRRELTEMQLDGALLGGPIDVVLLCPSFTSSLEQSCQREEVTPVTYSPALVLEEFYRRLRSLSQFVSIRPSDQGLWSIRLINRVVYALATNDNLHSLSAATGLSKKSVANHLRFAEALQLTTRVGDRFSLTDLGQRYMAARTADAVPNSMSEAQANVIRDFIIRDPFASPVVFGIYLIVDAVFALARNGYPVPWEALSSYFRDCAGKRFEWSSPTTEYHGVQMYSNYAAELGLLGRVGDNLYLTPDGLRSILLLQLHKSIQMLDAVSGFRS